MRPARPCSRARGATRLAVRRARLAGRAAALRRERDMYRTVADFTYDWEIWLGPDGAARYVSPSCRRLCGREPGELLGDPDFPQSLIHPEDRQAWRRAMAAPPDAPIPPLDFRILRADGVLVHFSQETTRVRDRAGRDQGLRLSLRDVTDRVRDQEALREAHEKLEERVRERTAALNEANRELRRQMRQKSRLLTDLAASREQFRNLSARLQERIEAEKTRIAREIHDELGQNLTALNMGLFRLESLLPGADPEVGRRLRGLREIVAEAVTQVRRISRELRPALLDELGFAEALERRARDFEDASGLAVSLSLAPLADTLDRKEAEVLYRVTQEALTNVARHARAGRVDIRLRRNRGRVLLEIADDGLGLDPKVLDDPASLGLAGMRERLRAVGGEVRVAQNPGGGLLLTAVLPRRGRA